MRNRALQVWTVLLLAIRRALTNPQELEGPSHLHNGPIPLGCLGLRTMIAAWTADPTGWQNNYSDDVVLNVPGVGQFCLFDPSNDEQLGSGSWALSLNNKRLLTQRDGHSLGDLWDAISSAIQAEYDQALERWLTNDYGWIELGPAEWPRYKSTRKFELCGRVIPQDRVNAHYALHFDPLNPERLHLSRDGVIRHRSDDPQVRQLYANLCQRPKFLAMA